MSFSSTKVMSQTWKSPTPRKNPNSFRRIVTGAGKTLSWANPRIYKNRLLRSHAGRPLFHRKVRAIHPRDGWFWRHWVLRLLDIGDFLRPTYPDLPWCRNLPNLLSHHRGRLWPLYQWQIPKQYRYSTQFSLQRFWEIEVCAKREAYSINKSTG